MVDSPKKLSRADFESLGGDFDAAEVSAGYECLENAPLPRQDSEKIQAVIDCKIADGDRFFDGLLKAGRAAEKSSDKSKLELMAPKVVEMVLNRDSNELTLGMALRDRASVSISQVEARIEAGGALSPEEVSDASARLNAATAFLLKANEIAARKPSLGSESATFQTRLSNARLALAGKATPGAVKLTDNDKVVGAIAEAAKCVQESEQNRKKKDIPAARASMREAYAILMTKVNDSDLNKQPEGRLLKLRIVAEYTRNALQDKLDGRKEVKDYEPGLAVKVFRAWTDLEEALDNSAYTQGVSGERLENYRRLAKGNMEKCLQMLGADKATEDFAKRYKPKGALGCNEIDGTTPPDQAQAACSLDVKLIVGKPGGLETFKEDYKSQRVETKWLVKTYYGLSTSLDNSNVLAKEYPDGLDLARVTKDLNDLKEFYGAERNKSIKTLGLDKQADRNRMANK